MESINRTDPQVSAPYFQKRHAYPQVAGNLNATTKVMVLPNADKKSERDPDCFLYLGPLDNSTGTWDFSSIGVSTFDVGTLNPGIRYTGGLSFTGPAGKYAQWSYDIDVTDDIHLIKDNAIYFGEPFTSGNDLALGIFERAVDKYYPGGPKKVADKSIGVRITPQGSTINSFDDALFAPTQGLRVTTAIDFKTKSSQSTSSINIYSFDQTFSQTVIPEPTTMLLFGSGLIGLAGFRRRFKK